MMRILSAAIIVLLSVAMPAHAQSPDRSQPVNIDADKVTVDDRNKVHVFEGSVILTQGTMMLKGDKIVVTQDGAGFHNGVATAGSGRLVSFRQKRMSDGAWVDGEAERIEYNSQNERAKLFNRAQIQSAGNLVRGQYIEYDAASENYLVTDVPGRPSGNTPPAGSRVHVTIQPKDTGSIDKIAPAATGH
ncbi:MAG: lipopolysaccharide transport periplasmic protein LptA [Betaproteobacteria bacterium]|nr:lipopolysaccharide transport periplasmic protein LptA [Betaproteobacteria bacterium]